MLFTLRLGVLLCPRRRARVLVCASLALALCPVLTAQPGGGQPIITTVAGGGSSLGDNGPATSAQLKAPTGVAVDSAGNLYIADNQSNRIRRVSNGVITTVAGGGSSLSDNGPATSAQLSLPTGVAVDSAGNLYIADKYNNRIRKVSNGVITTVAGNGGRGFSGDNGPATSAQLDQPSSVATDTAGNLYISDSGNDAVRKVSNGVITTVAGNGTCCFSGDNGPATTAQLYGPSGVAVDPAGNLYIADQGNYRIRKVSNGAITTVAGNGECCFSGDNGPATGAQLYYPAGVAVDSAGNLYIADTGNNRVRQVMAPASGVPPAGCVYAIDQNVQNFGVSGGSGSVGVLASASSCPWLVVNSASWITISPGIVASGTGLLTYTVAPNPNSAPRTGTIWIAGLSLTVTQVGVTCSLDVNPRNISAAATGATGGHLTVTSNAPDCAWNASASAPWILVSGGNNGAGNGTVTYTVGVNTGGLRTSTIAVAGQAVYVNQAASGASVSSLAAINAGGVVNAASYSPPIAAGGFVSVYGQNLADVATDWNSAITNGKLPMSLGGVQMLVNGKDAFICYVQPTQVNALVQPTQLSLLTPPEAATGPVEVDVITNHGTVGATVNLAAASPALFTYALHGTVYAAAQFASDYAYVLPSGALAGASSRPAKPGDYILLYATGLGQTRPAYPVGQVLTTAYPIADLLQVSVSVGGHPALVQFAGMTYAGLFQINIQVPSGVSNGNQPVVLQIGGQPSQGNVNLAIGGGQ